MLTDAPELVLELLVDEYDGWLDADAGEPAARSRRRSTCPTAPRRIKRPDSRDGSVELELGWRA